MTKAAHNIAFAKCGKTVEHEQQQRCRFGFGPDRSLISLVGILNFTFSI